MNPAVNSFPRPTTKGDWIDRYIPANLRAEPESVRRARLIAQFGLMGTLFGLIYALFYLLIGHKWGSGIIVICTVGMACTPYLMVWRKATELAGHFFAFTLTMGFFALCCVEGGAHGHALAWLVSVPLCALLLLGQRAATIWVGGAFLAAFLIVGCDLVGVRMPTTYPPEWEPIISAAGYLGLVMFMSLLGLIFERGRAQAHARMQAALKELEQSNEQLVHLNEEKSEFLGIAAHDLKNPLTAIMGNCELMKMIDQPEQLHDMADRIIVASERMHRLIKDLLDTNAIEEGRYTSKIEPCVINGLISQIVEQNHFSAKRKQIDIRLALEEDVVVLTDMAATLQILDNLISNAVKYSPPERMVHVRLVLQNGNAAVLVRDEGPGISDEDQKKLFQKYTRLTAKPTAGESSTGLGLSIAKRLAEALGGDIECQSALDYGTTFSLRLPLAENAASRPELVQRVGDILHKRAA